MAGYLARRLGAAGVAVLLSGLAVFLLMRAVPGDIVSQMLGQSGGNPGTEQALRAFFGLDRPLYVQFGQWLGAALHGDLGRSWYQGRPVGAMVFEAFQVTLELSVATLALATVVGVPLGVAAGIAQGTRLDSAIQTFNIIGLSAPVFWLGLMLLIGVNAAMGWSPPLVWTGPGEGLADNLGILALPVLSLATLQAASYSQFVRGLMIEELGKDYIRAARAKGLKPAELYFKHALANVMIPLVTFMGLILVQILGGVVVIESLFSLPGLGRLILTAIQGRDYPVVQGALFFVVVLATGINLAVDLLYGLLDPRLRR
jgi:peptide/nickel transport system permease protein